MVTAASPTVRASDADRERVAAILTNAAGRGLLTINETDERLARVYAARHLIDLAPITADLPDGGRPLAPIDLAVRSAARARLARHATLYLVGVGAVLAVWLVTGAGFFWPAWPIIGFGIGVWSHARAARRAGDPTGDPTGAEQAVDGRTEPHRPQGCGSRTRARTAPPAVDPGPAPQPTQSTQPAVRAGGPAQHVSRRQQANWTSLGV